MSEEETEDAIKSLDYKHKIEPGISKVQNYGLMLASKTHLPEDTLKLAKELSEVIACNKNVKCFSTLIFQNIFL